MRLVDIAELLGVSKQRADQIANETGFPEPVERTSEAGFGIGVYPTLNAPSDSASSGATRRAAPSQSC
jgi:hypothetical protein